MLGKTKSMANVRTLVWLDKKGPEQGGRLRGPASHGKGTLNYHPVRVKENSNQTFHSNSHEFPRKHARALSSKGKEKLRQQLQCSSGFVVKCPVWVGQWNLKLLTWIKSVSCWYWRLREAKTNPFWEEDTFTLCSGETPRNNFLRGRASTQSEIGTPYIRPKEQELVEATAYRNRPSQVPDSRAQG